MHRSRTLIVSDLDGTLLRSDKSVSDRTRRSLIAAREAGLRTAVASARPLRLIDDVLGDITTLFDVLIVSNGAAVIDPASRTTIYEHRLSVEDAIGTIQRIRQQWPTAGFGWELGTHFISDQTFIDLSRRTTILRDPVVEEVTPFPRAGVHQLVFAVPGAAPAALVETAGETIGGGYWVTDSNGGVVEISTSAVTKAEAARWWAQSIGRSLADVVAFGDELNDLPLLQEAGMGYAMGNAAPHVQRVAQRTTGTNDDDGVAVVIENLIAQTRTAS